MARILNISGNKFSTELQTLEIDEVYQKSVTLTIETGGVTVFTSTFTPDSDKKVFIYNFRDILETYINDTFAVFDIYVVEEGGGGRYSGSPRVFKTAVNVSEKADDFLPSFFLTTLINQKKTQSNRYETLSFYTEEKCNVIATVTYLSNGIINTEEVELMTEEQVALRTVNTIDVSPRKVFNESKGVAIKYVIRAGERSFTFVVDDTQPTAEPALLFRNNFGCWETMYLTGTVETDYSIKRSHAYIAGKYRLYDIEDTEKIKANSGILNGTMLNLGKDLARSKSVFLIDSQGNAEQEIVIDDSEVKYTNEDDALPTFEYTYRRTSFVSTMLHIIRPPKLFDKTFDITFN